MLQRRKLLFNLMMIAIASVIALCLLELASYAIIVVNDSNFYLPLGLSELSSRDVEVRQKETMFSPELGWEPTYPNEHGYRGKEKNLDNAAIALFGDSFVQGHGVIEQSWPYLLEQKLKQPVLNFGVGGYGSDQAYLRFEKRYVNELQTPYVALLVMSENIARVMNRYRGFYKRKSRIELTKPMFYKHEDGSIRLLPNPLQSLDDIEMLGNMQVLKEIGEHDYWYEYFEQFDLNHFVHFPYSYYLLRALPYYLKRGYQHRSQNLCVYETMYEEPGAAEILRFSIMSFVDRAKEIGAVPMVVFLPNWKDMVDYRDTDRTIYHGFFDELKNDYYPDVYDGLAYFLPYLEEGNDVSAFFISRLDGHYNSVGERVVSEGFYQTLVSIDSTRGLLELNE